MATRGTAGDTHTHTRTLAHANTRAAPFAVNFVELYVFDVNQRDVGASAVGAVLSMGTTYGTNYASYGGDNLADPFADVTTGQFANTGCTDTSDFYKAVFPPAAGFPNGFPIGVSNVRGRWGESELR